MDFESMMLSEKLNLPECIKNKIANAGKPFSEYLKFLMEKKEMKSPEIWARAGMDRQYYSKLMKDEIHPTKERILMLAIGLKLNIDETMELLNYMGYSLSENQKLDIIFRHYIENKEYDIIAINEECFKQTNKSIFGKERRICLI